VLSSTFFFVCIEMSPPSFFFLLFLAFFRNFMMIIRYSIDESQSIFSSHVMKTSRLLEGSIFSLTNRHSAEGHLGAFNALSLELVIAAHLVH
jgi:hypothetical protein